MNKSYFSEKRTIRRPQPKRPKLDFSVRSSFSCPTNSTDRPVNRCVTTERSSSLTSIESNKIQDASTTSDWDEDFPNELLEKVCLIAGLSEAMVSSEKIAKESPNKVVDKQGCKRTLSERDNPGKDSDIFEDLATLRAENEKLKESIRTKEGEVHILRSQLRQNQEAKRTEILKNMKVMEEMQVAYKEKIEATQKEFDATRTELHFKDLELKNLTDRCKQLESNVSKIKLVEPQLPKVKSESKKAMLNASHLCANSTMKDDGQHSSLNKEEPILFELPIQVFHEGQKFGNVICPEFFNFIEEPSVIPFYPHHRGCGFHVSNLDFDTRENYKWNGLPKQNLFVKDTYSLVTSLFPYENFVEKSARDAIEKLLDISMQILLFQKRMFSFLEQLQDRNSECDDSDYSLLENEDEVNVITLKDVLEARKLNREECGIESRRILGMIVCLMQSSRLVLELLIQRADFVMLLKDLVTSVGTLRSPTRHTGILMGVAFILTQFLQKRSLKTEFLGVLKEVTEEIIFARPKLDVLNQVIEVLAVSNNHTDFIKGLCRKGSVESCALYMDSRLHQAMFFTKDACPLKLVCTQIMGLSCIPVNREMKWIVTRSIVKWLNRMMDSSLGHEIKWLPNNAVSDKEDKYFNVMECFVYLLNSCLRDYMFFYWNFHKKKDEIDVTVCGKRSSRCDLLTIIGDGSILLRRILKSDQRLLQESSHNLRFVTLLKNFSFPDGLNSHQKQALVWLRDLLEGEPRNPETGCEKQDASNPLDQIVIDALRINDDLMIF